MKEAYLHIGSPKTGTTAIQTMYGMNPHLLTEAGIAFPPFPDCFSTEDSSIYLGNGADLLRLTYNFSPAIDKYLLDLFSSADKMFISYESFIRCYPEHINFLCDAFKRNNIKLHVIIVFRNLYDYFFSLWKQSVYQGYRFSFPEYVIEKKELNIFSTFGDLKFSLDSPFLCLENFKQNQDIDIIVLHYDSLKKNIFEKFSQILGTKYVKIEKPVNASISYLETEMVRDINNKIHDQCSFTEREEFFFVRIISNVAKIFANSDDKLKQKENISTQRKPFYKSVLQYLIRTYSSKIKKLNNEYDISLQILTPDDKFCQPVEINYYAHTAKLVQEFYETLNAERSR